MIKFDIEVLKEELANLEAKEAEKDQEYKRELRELEDQKKKQINRWQNEFNEK